MKQINAREAVLEHFRWDGGHADVWAVFRNGPRWRPWCAGWRSRSGARA